MASELAARVRIPFEFVSVGRKLQQSTVPLRVNMENPWTINRKIVVSSLRQVGLFQILFLVLSIRGKETH